VVATIGAIQAVVFLAASVVVLEGWFGQTPGQRAVLLLLVSLGMTGLWLLAVRHLKRHPTQAQSATTAPRKTAV
jgi:hypothetical protein